MINADFKKAAHNTILKIFPKCKIFGCTFHLEQNWFKQIQQNKILKSEYLKDSEIGKRMKYFYGLNYLPPNEVSDDFTGLMARAPGVVSFIFSDYILENYINSNNNFPSILWAYKLNGNPRRRIAQKVSINIIIANFIYRIHTLIKSLIYSYKSKVKQI